MKIKDIRELYKHEFSRRKEKYKLPTRHHTHYIGKHLKSVIMSNVGDYMEQMELLFSAEGCMKYNYFGTQFVIVS